MKKIYFLFLLTLLPLLASADVLEIHGIYYNLYSSSDFIITAVTQNPHKCTDDVIIPYFRNQVIDLRRTVSAFRTLETADVAVVPVDVLRFTSAFRTDGEFIYAIGVLRVFHVAYTVIYSLLFR